MLFLILTLLLGLSSPWLAAADGQLENIGPPEASGVPAELLGLLNSQGIRVLQDGNARAEFWFRKELPLNETPSSALGVSYGKMAVGTFSGLVNFPSQWEDYRKQPIRPGLYSLRYGVQPADGNHMGVSFYRDYLLLVPISEESGQVVGDMDALVDLSSKVTGTPHPAVLSLFPIYEEISEPRLLSNDLDQSTLAIRIGEVTLGLVMEGHGEIE